MSDTATNPIEPQQDLENPRLWSPLRSLCRIFTDSVFRLRTYGISNVPRCGGVLLICNHQSNLDPVVVAVHLRCAVSFLAKAELFEHPGFGWLISELNAFPVRRGEGDVGAVRETIRRLREGRILTLFPEGTRTPNGEIGAIMPGIAMIVRRAQVPVIPAVVDGAYLAWPRDAKFPRPHPIKVLYGPPMAVEGLKGEQIISLIDRTLRGMLAELRGM